MRYSFKMKLIIYVLFLLISIHTVYADETPPRIHEETFCEGETAKLSCPNGTVISIQLANYGRFSVRLCNPSAEDLRVDCHNDKTLEILKNRCGINNFCNVTVGNEVFGDACPETSKYLEVAYICVPPPATTTTTTTTPLPTTTSSSTTQSSNIAKSSLTSLIPTSPPKFCPPVNERFISWPKTESGNSAKVKCPTKMHGLAEWYCSIEGKWEQQPDLSGCVSHWTKELEEDVENEASKLSTQLETLKDIHSHTKRESLVGGELIKISTIVKKVVHNYVTLMKNTMPSEEIHNKSLAMNRFLIEVINFLLSNHQQAAWTDINASKQRHVASTLLDSSEKLLASIFPATSTPSLTTMTENFVAKPHIHAQVSTVSVFDYVAFPSTPLGKNVIHIPKEALEVSGGHNAQVLYADFDGFQRFLQPLPNPENEYPKVLASKILTASVVLHGHPESVLRIVRPVVLHFHTESSKNLSNPQCVWWDHSSNDWSTNGCTLKSANDSSVICECSHLTHFAILMDVRGIQLPIGQEILLTVITYLGCILSIFCLSCSFLAFFIFADSSCDRNTIHMNLSLTLAIGELVFLLGIYRTDDKLTCTIVAAVLQYFFLSAFCWMFLEGLQLYFMLVQVFTSRRSRKPWFYLIAYGIPTIVSALSFYWNPEGFGTERHCWLSTENNFIWTFVGPATLCLTCNFLFLLMTLCIVCKHSNVGYKPCRHDFDTVKMVRAWLKGSFALVFLLGLTWTSGYFWIDRRSVWVAYVFTVLNTLQGVGIFIFHIVLNDKMHSDYANWVRRNDWLPSCLRDPTLNVRDRRTGPYIPSTATSSGHTGTSDSSNGSDGMSSQSLPRKSREYKRSRGIYNDDDGDETTTDPLLYHGQCPNCSHSATILYSASNTLRRGGGGDYSEKPLPESPEEQPLIAFYSSTPKRSPQLSTNVNYPGQQWAQQHPLHRGPKQIYNSSLKEAMENYHHGIPDNEVYDYATIPYEDNHLARAQQHSYRTNYGVDLYPSSNNTLQHHQQQHYPRPPPTFKPPPPPSQIISGGAAVSDDSAYSDSGASSSRSPNSLVSRNGTMLLRMDLSKNPPVFCEGV